MTNNTPKKIEKLVSPQNSLHVSQCEFCVAVPGQNSCVDVINPITALTWYGGKTVVQAIEENPGAEVMTLDEFTRQMAERQHTPIEWEPSTYEAFDYGLNVLPPAIWIGGAFMVGEPCDHDASNGKPRFQAFRESGDIYEKATRPMTRDEFREEVKLGAGSSSCSSCLSRFADPNGDSSLHTGDRTEPCPTCGEPNTLTKRDVQSHYQCDTCAARAEGTYVGGDY